MADGPLEAPHDMMVAIDTLARLCERREWPFVVAVQYAKGLTRVRLSGTQGDAEQMVTAIQDATTNEVRRLTQDKEVPRG